MEARQIIHDLGADVVAFNEHRMNLKHPKNINGFRKMFQGGESELRAVASHNIHESTTAGVYQEGGTCLMGYGTMVEYLDLELSGKDDSGLGRWTHLVFKGEDGFRTRVVCAYCPCYNKNLASGTSYSQQKRYWLQKGVVDCPRTKCKSDLLHQLTKWRQEGDRLIVCMDVNEHIYTKSMGRQITDPNGLAMVEVVGNHTGTNLGATYFRGTKPIDAIWATSDIQVVGARVMPCGYGVGDHRLFIIDFLISSMVGHSHRTVVRPAARRLNTRIPGVAAKYNAVLVELLQRHKLLERLEWMKHNKLKAAQATRLINKIDREGSQYMAAAEAKCRKIRAGCIPFSPEAVSWLRRLQVYRALLKNKAGKIKHRGNLVRAARRVGIVDPLRISEQVLRERVDECYKKAEYLKKTGWLLRRRHLHAKCEEAAERGDSETVKQILALIKREKERAFWGRIRFAFGKKQGRSVSTVQVEDAGGNITEHSGQREVQAAIFSEIHQKRFFLAEQAPICNGWLRDAFGYTATSPVAKAILNGSYTYPHDFDQATKELCMACARIRQSIPKNSVPSDISQHQWSRRWRKAKEDTSSSVSGLHFGHYKASALHPELAKFHALKASLVMKRGMVLERWGNGLSVMLEKLFGCTMVSKLRSILLMEADFNFTNKSIFGSRMMGNARKYNMIPEEIFSEKNKTADDGTLAKILFFDIARQSRRPAGVASVDADNCFDRIAHAMASLCFQAFGVNKLAAQAMLRTIQDMKFFLRTAFGDSKTYSGATIEMKTQGLCQGNGAAPAGWAVVSVVILDAHKQHRHGAHFRCPITKGTGELAAILFVDDTDLLHMNMERLEHLEETHEALQTSVTSWGTKLLATGGALKPPKCFYYLIDFEWLEDGSWRYKELQDEELVAFQIRVPSSTGRMHLIDYVRPSEARKTLGTMTCPTGDPTASLERMQKLAQEWVDTAKNAKMHRRHLWLMLQRQFWARVGYAIGTSVASMEQLEDVFKKQYFALLPLLGVRRSIHRSFRMLDSGFGGIGLPNPAVECGVAQLSKLMMHYGCPSAVGTILQTSMELFILELGMSSTLPFAPSYKRYNTLVTHCWLKSVWEKCSTFNITVRVGNVSLPFPRAGDKWLMLAFIEAGYDIHDLQVLNRVRIHQEALFVSDVLNASGRSVDLKYTSERSGGTSWSSIRFPQERPTESDMTLWTAALFRISPMGRAILRMREFSTMGHKRWDWRHDEEKDQLLYQPVEGGPIEVYKQVGRVNQWHLQDGIQHAGFSGSLCSVKWLSPTTVSFQGSAPPPLQPPQAMTLLDLLAESTDTWTWKNIEITGQGDWLAQAIQENTCMAVTDGSYMPEVTTEACSAAFIIECSKGRGTLTGSFVEKSLNANAYRGELMGLMAIHLILDGINRLHPTLLGTARLFSDCLGAIDRVEHIPTPRIPAKCKHSDVLKNIMIHKQKWSFTVTFNHVKAHQDDLTPFHMLDRPAQLNCLMDAKAKETLRAWGQKAGTKQLPFPLEPIAIYVGKDKISGDMSDMLRYWINRQIARPIFAARKIMDGASFDKVDWLTFWTAMRSTPRLFQVWASKQIMNLAHTNKFRAKFTEGLSPLCPSCKLEEETCDHVIKCNEKGRVQSLLQSLETVDKWLSDSYTEPGLHFCIMTYARGRGGMTMSGICSALGPEYRTIGYGQDVIGWRRFMEGMIAKDMVGVQRRYLSQYHIRGDAMAWARSLCTRLLECTHGQWLYRNVIVHDKWDGELVTTRRELIQQQVEEQLELEEELLEEHQYLMEINMGEMERGTGEGLEYWLLAVQAARAAKRLAEDPKGIG